MLVTKAYLIIYFISCIFEITPVMILHLVHSIIFFVSSSDVHCGRIQCQGGNDRPLLGSNAEILTTKVILNHRNFTCRGAYFDLGDDVSDPAMVAQGTACAPGKVRLYPVQLLSMNSCIRCLAKVFFPYKTKDLCELKIIFCAVCILLLKD